MSDGAATVAILGGGVAGASLAAHLAEHRGTGEDIVVLEAEHQPGYHATGRSVATYVPDYGPPVIRALTQASGPFFFSPPETFTSGPLVKALGLLTIAPPGSEAALEHELALGPTLVEISTSEARERCPVLTPDAVTRAAFAQAAQEIDVAALHQGYLRRFRQAGGHVVCGAAVETLARRGAAWDIVTNAGTWTADSLVNAAGAWADEVAALAGVPRLGLSPLKRTAVLVETTCQAAKDTWPMVADVDGTFYFKPESGQLVVSPEDATPTPSSDVRPDDIDVAVAIDRLQRHTTLDVRRVRHSWAGLRTFAADGNPVIGADPTEPSFFWLAGQGGYGICTAPACAELAACMLTRQTPNLPEVSPADIAPARFATGAALA